MDMTQKVPKKRFVLELDDQDRERLEVLRVRYGARSWAQALRFLIACLSG